MTMMQDRWDPIIAQFVCVEVSTGDETLDRIAKSTRETRASDNKGPLKREQVLSDLEWLVQVLAETKKRELRYEVGYDLALAALQHVGSALCGNDKGIDSDDPRYTPVLEDARRVMIRVVELETLAKYRLERVVIAERQRDTARWACDEGLEIVAELRARVAKLDKDAMRWNELLNRCATVVKMRAGDDMDTVPDRVQARIEDLEALVTALELAHGHGPTDEDPVKCAVSEPSADKDWVIMVDGNTWYREGQGSTKHLQVAGLYPQAYAVEFAAKSNDSKRPLVALSYNDALLVDLDDRWVIVGKYSEDQREWYYDKPGQGVVYDLEGAHLYQRGKAEAKITERQRKYTRVVHGSAIGHPSCVEPVMENARGKSSEK